MIQANVQLQSCRGKFISWVRTKREVKALEVSARDDPVKLEEKCLPMYPTNKIE